MGTSYDLSKALENMVKNTDINLEDVGGKHF
jgi:hypothetical protein